jgi:hypothetical protein
MHLRNNNQKNDHDNFGGSNNSIGRIRFFAAQSNNKSATKNENR